MCEWKYIKNELPKDGEKVLVLCSDNAIKCSNKIYKNGFDKICIMEFEQSRNFKMSINGTNTGKQIQSQPLFKDLIGGNAWGFKDIICWMPLPNLPVN